LIDVIALFGGSRVDPVRAIHRPLILYTFMKAMWILSGLLLRSRGFRRYYSGQLTYWYRPSSTGAAVVSAAPAAPPGGAAVDSPRQNDNGNGNGGVAAPMSPVSASVAADPHPLVFIHGIGIGLIAYHWFLAGCWPSRATFVVELPHISMQLVTADMTIEETVDAIDHMLRAHQVEQACFMGHSFGSICVTWMIKHRPEMVSSTILLDPVRYTSCFIRSRTNQP
jgi:pimeloyl-ACP methyl ester carboxylesterase